MCGDVAVRLHGYQRDTTDVDLNLERERANDARQILESTGLQWDGVNKEFRTAGGIAVQFLMTGDRVGKDSEVRLPSPTGDLNVETIEGLPVLRLSRLIEIKIACGAVNVRRMHKDFADVVELIAIRKLGAPLRNTCTSLSATFTANWFIMRRVSRRRPEKFGTPSGLGPQARIPCTTCP